MTNPLVSIIIPVYGVEDYIARCARSVFRQTYQNLEIIFVDDCTPDNSIGVLRAVMEEYPERKAQVKILKHDHNLGLSAARNTGLEAATGEYIFHCDSDDWMDDVLVEHLMEKVLDEGFDLVYSDYYETYLDKELRIAQDVGTNGENCVIAMLYGKLRGCNWSRIIKSTLYTENNIKYVEKANMHEDIGTMLRIFAVANKIGYVNEAHYHYIQYNGNSLLSSSGSSKKRRIATLQRIKNTCVALDFLKQKGYNDGKFQAAANYFMQYQKFSLIDESTYSLKKWIVTFPESDSSIWRIRHFTVNIKLLLTWLHYHQIWLYKLQTKVGKIINAILK